VHRVKGLQNRKGETSPFCIMTNTGVFSAAPVCSSEALEPNMVKGEAGERPSFSSGGGDKQGVPSPEKREVGNFIESTSLYFRISRLKGSAYFNP
jgi:hypothetical protein